MRHVDGAGPMPMTKQKTPYTPGPWTAIADPAHFDSLTTVVGGAVNNAMPIPSQMIVQVGGHAEVKEAEANARLIASAPDLLAELQSIAKADPTKWEEDIRDLFQQWAQSRARAAIAKATGDAQ